MRCDHHRTTSAGQLSDQTRCTRLTSLGLLPTPPTTTSTRQNASPSSSRSAPATSAQLSVSSRKARRENTSSCRRQLFQRSPHGGPSMKETAIRLRSSPDCQHRHRNRRRVRLSRDSPPIDSVSGTPEPPGSCSGRRVVREARAFKMSDDRAANAAHRLTPLVLWSRRYPLARALHRGSTATCAAANLSGRQHAVSVPAAGPG